MLNRIRLNYLFQFVISSLFLLSCSTTPKQPARVEFLNRPFWLIGHRGAAAYAPENTMESFDVAYSLGLYDVELDIQLSRDNEVVIFHDGDMNKKTILTGSIRDHNWSELTKTDIGIWYDRERGSKTGKYVGAKLITLRQLFQRYGKTFYYHVEIKSEVPELCAEALKVIKDSGMMDNALITSFSFEQLVRFRDLNSGLKLSYLIGKESGDKMNAAAVTVEIKKAFEAKLQQVAVNAAVINPEHVSLAHTLGLSIRAWGIKSDDDMKAALRAGAQGMTTDWPDHLTRELLQQLR